MCPVRGETATQERQREGETRGREEGGKHGVEKESEKEQRVQGHHAQGQRETQHRVQRSAGDRTGDGEKMARAPFKMKLL